MRECQWTAITGSLPTSDNSLSIDYGFTSGSCHLTILLRAHVHVGTCVFMAEPLPPFTLGLVATRLSRSFPPRLTSFIRPGTTRTGKTVRPIVPTCTCRYKRQNLSPILTPNVEALFDFTAFGSFQILDYHPRMLLTLTICFIPHQLNSHNLMISSRVATFSLLLLRQIRIEKL